MEIENAQQLAVVVLAAIAGILILFKVGKALVKVAFIVALLIAIALVWQKLGTL